MTSSPGPRSQARQAGAARGIGQRQGMFGAHKGGELGFKSLGDSAHGEPARPDHRGDGFFFFGAVVEIRKGNFPVQFFSSLHKDKINDG